MLESRLNLSLFTSSRTVLGSLAPSDMETRQRTRRQEQERQAEEAPLEGDPQDGANADAPDRDTDEEDDDPGLIPPPTATVTMTATATMTATPTALKRMKGQKTQASTAPRVVRTDPLSTRISKKRTNWRIWSTWAPTTVVCPRHPRWVTCEWPVSGDFEWRS